MEIRVAHSARWWAFTAACDLLDGLQWKHVKATDILGHAERKEERRQHFLVVERGGEVCSFAGDAFKRLGEKDLLAQAVEEAGMGGFVPRTKLVPWDAATVEEIVLPQVPEDEVGVPQMFVLKPPLGCQGDGIEFVGSREEILPIIIRDATNARNEKGFLEEIQRQKGRLPSWVVQRFVDSMLINNRPFHVRAYVVVRDDGENVRSYFRYDEYEVRIALENERLSNGSKGATRFLLDEVDQLREYKPVLDEFIDNFLIAGEHILSPPSVNSLHKTYSFAALDIMIDQTARPYLLEVNARSCGCPEREELSPSFEHHMINLAKDILTLILTIADDKTLFKEIV